jgi:threonine/homoserine/homoserine lactone efflux protein
VWVDDYIKRPESNFFYISFLPAFVDLSTASFMDATLIMAMATTAVCLTKLTYAYMADKADTFLITPPQKKECTFALTTLSGSWFQLIK